MRIRTFVAVDLEGEREKRVIGDIQAEIEATGNRVKMVEPENLHLTLKFLGEVDESLIPELAGVLGEIEFEEFDAELRGLGAFPGISRPRVIWVGFGEGRDLLADLMRRVEAAVSRLGFRRERRPPSPHLTICRVKYLSDPAALKRVIEGLSEIEVGSMRVSSFKLKRSILTPRGPVYEDLRSFAARGKN